MATVIRFSTSKFDVSLERPNPINPIHGESLLLWLKSKASPAIDIPAPEAEDWGWYSYVDWKGRSYLLGSSAEEEQNIEREWVLQIVKERSIKERILGREKMHKDDECVLFLVNILAKESSFNALTVEQEP